MMNKIQFYFCLFIIIGVIVLDFLVVLDNEENAIYEYTKHECEKMKGNLEYWECQEIPYAGIPCKDRITGYVCFVNGTPIKIQVNTSVKAYLTGKV